MAEGPNLLLFVSDQQQWRTICGRSPARSPNIDRLAAEGLRSSVPSMTSPAASRGSGSSPR